VLSAGNLTILTDGRGGRLPALLLRGTTLTAWANDEPMPSHCHPDRSGGIYQNNIRGSGFLMIEVDSMGNKCLRYKLPILRFHSDSDLFGHPSHAFGQLLDKLGLFFGAIVSLGRIDIEVEQLNAVDGSQLP